MKNRNILNSYNWPTPKYFYDILNAEFNFNYDPCPLEYGEITKEKDGLLKDWGGGVVLLIRLILNILRNNLFINQLKNLRKEN